MNSYKQCPNCGRQFPVTDVFCDNCGCQLDLIAPEQAQPPQQPFVLPTQQPPAQTTTVYAEKPKKNRRTDWSVGCDFSYFGSNDCIGILSHSSIESE